MKLTRRILLTSILAAVALPIAAQAAKANRKNAAPPSFETVDKDNDKSISEAELVAAMKDKPGGEEAAKTQFATFDKDKDGKMTKEEYAASAGEKKKRKKKEKKN